MKHLLDTYPSDLLCIDAEKNVVYVNHYGREGKYKIECIRPYLRLLSSMTEEEQKEFVKFHCTTLCPIVMDSALTVENESSMIDWLNRKMFDYRGLIPKGLALEAPEGMYNN